ncbi:MAG: methionyl-tRNA formyltransferase [Candidatus Amulumruptor caecigallinarius]|nr:methionyl-tRNA formyltransferase [Candidatus Amulumruptor caecigallinarius]
MKENNNIRIVFFGTPEFAVASLGRLVEKGFDVAAVVTMPDKIAGRGHKLLQSDVKKFAVAHGIPVLQPEKLRSEAFLAELREINADLFIVIAFRMLPEVVWSMPPLGTFNIHGSLLPKYRGAAPINRAVMNGEKVTGLTSFFLKHEIDTGDMIEQCSIEIADSDNAGTVHDRLMAMSADMVESTVNKICEGSLETMPQPEGDFVAAPKIFKQDCEIKWTNSTISIHNQIRGLSPYPAAFTTITDENGKIMTAKIFTSRIVDGAKPDDEAMPHEEPGKIFIAGKQMYVKTGDGWLEILELQPAGKKRISTAAYLAGYHPFECITPHNP